MDVSGQLDVPAALPPGKEPVVPVTLHLLCMGMKLGLAPYGKNVD
jgi:hypothetical protein